MKALFVIALIAMMMSGMAWAEEYGLYVVASKQECFDSGGNRLALLCIVEKHEDGRIVHAEVIYNSTGGTIISPSILLDELFAASEGVLPYLNAPSDRIDSVESVTLEHRLPPNEIELAERKVEQLKNKDAAILRFRKALQAIK